jgi:hypothetical protein
VDISYTCHRPQGIVEEVYITVEADMAKDMAKDVSEESPKLGDYRPGKEGFANSAYTSPKKPVKEVPGKCFTNLGATR